VRLVVRDRAPGFAVKRERGMTLASDSSRLTTLLPESALARRFRGFIDPQPMSQNAFETLRKPHLVALNLEAAPAMPPASVEPAPVETASPVAAAKQDRATPQPVASEAAPIVTKQVALTDALTPKLVPQVETVLAPAPAFALASASPEVIVTESPPSKPAEDPSRFPVHKLVLALCGALGAASALRFIVRA